MTQWQMLVGGMAGLALGAAIGSLASWLAWQPSGWLARIGHSIGNATIVSLRHLPCHTRMT